MADRFYGVNQGKTEFDVVEDTSSPAKSVEVCVDLAVHTTATGKNEVLLALEQIKNHILTNQWPPA